MKGNIDYGNEINPTQYAIENDRYEEVPFLRMMISVAGSLSLDSLERINLGGYEGGVTYA